MNTKENGKKQIKKMKWNPGAIQHPHRQTKMHNKTNKFVTHRRYESCKACPTSGNNTSSSFVMGKYVTGKGNMNEYDPRQGQ